MAWWNAMCAFDMETTGIETETDRIVTATVVRVVGATTAVSRRCRACSRIADRTPRRVNQQRERRARAKEARNGG